MKTNRLMKYNHAWITAGPLWIALLTLGPCVLAATLTLAAIADTSIFESKPDSNLGATTLVSGTNQAYSRSRSMFAFDLGAIPLDALITGVQVALYVTRQPDPDQHGGPVNSDFSLYRMLVSWGEGSGTDNTGSAAMAGDATWNERHCAADSWGTPGGLIGTDFASTPSATMAIGGIGSYIWGSSSTLLDDVTIWQTHPAANFGFMLLSQDEASLGSARRFGSKEQPGGAIAPAQLLVTYTLAPEPEVASLWLLGLAGLALRRARPQNLTISSPSHMPRSAPSHPC